MNEDLKSLDKFGKFLMETLRDNSMQSFEWFADKKHKAPSLQFLQNQFSSFSEEQVEIIKRVFITCLDSGIHDFLFAIQENYDFDNDINILVDDKNIAELSDGIQGELFTEDGWFSKFSKHGELEEA